MSKPAGEEDCGCDVHDYCSLHAHVNEAYTKFKEEALELGEVHESLRGNMPTPANEWREEFDRHFLGTDGCHEFSKQEIESGTWTIYAYAVKNFIQNLLTTHSAHLVESCQISNFKCSQHGKIMPRPICPKCFPDTEDTTSTVE
jgi:hypothetical protein